MKPVALSTPRFSSAFAATSIALAVLAQSPNAHAELDGVMPAPASQATSAAASSAASDAAEVQQSLLNGALRMRTFTDAGGTAINEYATSTGRIVAYSWSGPTMPDLHVLLGQYSASYQAGVAAAAADSNLHDSRIVLPNLIVESGGPMRGYVGRAWLPEALPPGVTADDFE